MLAVTGHGLLDEGFLQSMLDTLVLNDPATETRCASVRSSILSLHKAVVDLRDPATVRSIEGLLRGIHGCFMARLDVATAFASLMHSATQRTWEPMW